jgi:hypothetical protein
MADHNRPGQGHFISYAEYLERFRKVEFDQAVAQIGLMNVRFQSLEATLKTGIAYFVNPKDDVYGAIVTEKLPFKALTRALRNLVEYHSEKNNLQVDLAAFDEVLAACSQCEEDRNRIIHSVWYPSEEGPMRFKQNFRPGKEWPVPMPTFLNDLQKITDRMVSAAFALSALFYWNFPEQKDPGEAAP